MLLEGRVSDVCLGDVQSMPSAIYMCFCVCLFRLNDEGTRLLAAESQQVNIHTLAGAIDVELCLANGNPG